MDSITIMENMQKKIHERLMYRDGKITAVTGQNGGTYESLSEISRHIELLTADLREVLVCCHNELQALGYYPQELPMPDAPDIDVWVEEQNVRIVVDGMLPFPLKGGVHFLHEKFDAALQRYSRENVLPKPLFDEGCAVLFIHHYAMTRKAVRNMRDYDT